MASDQLILSREAAQVIEVIKSGQNFLLSGGAGSGKTYTLVEIIKAVFEMHPTKRVSCITYTNAAVREIVERVSHPNLNVSTIHEFLWDSIKHFQSELKNTLLELIRDDERPEFTLPEGIAAADDLFASLQLGIQYKEFTRLKDGIISHDELLILSERMFAKYKKLCDLVKDNSPFIFVDEYQDTSTNVVSILLQHMKKSDKKNVVGFFGDAMQSIYDGSVGNLDSFRADGNVFIEVKKEQNRRNPRLVIDLANTLRNDGLKQHPSDDVHAPNMDTNGQVKQGTCLFLHSKSDDLNLAKSYLGWDFNDSLSTKELNLTHNMIAKQAGFEDLMRIYDGDKILEYVRRVRKYIKDSSPALDTAEKTFRAVVEELKIGKPAAELKKIAPTDGMAEYIARYDSVFSSAMDAPYEKIATLWVDKDQLLDDKKNDVNDLGKLVSERDDLIKHLFKIQNNIRIYKEGRFNDFIRATDFQLSSIKTKNALKALIDTLVNVGDKTIAQVISEADASGIVKVGDRLLKFKSEKSYVYEQVSQIPFAQFQKLYSYLEGFTPFSTQHKTKGAEFDNVLVILDNGKWNNYNFEYLFTDRTDKESVLHRTQKIFYVCCTRAKQNLAVFYQEPTDVVLNKAREWFGEKNVIDLEAVSFSQ